MGNSAASFSMPASCSKHLETDLPLVVTIKEATRGRSFCAMVRSFARRLFAANGDRDAESIARDAKAELSHPELSSREREIASLVACGRTNGEIGRALHISHKTVEKHLGSLYQKIGTSSPIHVATLLSQSDRMASGSELFDRRGSHRRAARRAGLRAERFAHGVIVEGAERARVFERPIEAAVRPCVKREADDSVGRRDPPQRRSDDDARLRLRERRPIDMFGSGRALETSELRDLRVERERLIDRFAEPRHGVRRDADARDLAVTVDENDQVRAVFEEADGTGGPGKIRIHASPLTSASRVARDAGRSARRG